MNACSAERDLDEGNGRWGIPRRAAAHTPSDHGGAGERETPALHGRGGERGEENGEMEEM